MSGAQGLDTERTKPEEGRFRARRRSAPPAPPRGARRPSNGAARADRVTIAGLAIDRLDMDETVARCEQLIAGGGFAQHVSVNAAKVVAARDDPRLREIIEQCELVSADGQSVVWASRMVGDALPGRVAGIDLMQELLALAERRGYRVFILGARPEVLARAVDRISEDHPRLKVGAHHGYFDESEDAEVARKVAAARPHILFVAISSPRKEYWLGHHGREIGVPFVMGVGGAVDVIAGATTRAPLLLQRLGLEWAFRLAQEPRRLIRRYATTNARFVSLMLREAFARRLLRR